MTKLYTLRPILAVILLLALLLVFNGCSNESRFYSSTTDVIVENNLVDELELIGDPIPAKAAYGWDDNGNDVYKDTFITSLVLRSTGATITCDLNDVAPDFLTMGDHCAYVLMMDGTKVPLYGMNAHDGIQNLKAESSIDLTQVVSVFMPDGMEIKAGYRE